MVVKSHVGDLGIDIPAREVEPFLYEFEFSQQNKVIGILEIYVNGEQIPESPIQVQVIDRDCEAAFPGKNRAPVSLFTPTVKPGPLFYSDTISVLSVQIIFKLVTEYSR
jgi:hypothetical protein